MWAVVLAKCVCSDHCVGQRVLDRLSTRLVQVPKSEHYFLQTRLYIIYFFLHKEQLKWNRLSADCVGANSVNIFKNKIDIYLRGGSILK